MNTRSLLAALLIIVGAMPAHAALIYSGVQNVPIPADFEGVYLRMSNGTITGNFPADWNTAPWLNPFFGGVAVGSSDLLRPIITGTDQIVNLAPGTVIDASGNFVAGESGSSTHTGLAPDQFHVGVPGIMGFVFNIIGSGPDLYGWLRMTVNDSGAGNIVDWAYDDTAGTGVLAGLTAVPEPAAVLVGMALCGVSVLRRRRGA